MGCSRGPRRKTVTRVSFDTEPPLQSVQIAPCRAMLTHRRQGIGPAVTCRCVILVETQSALESDQCLRMQALIKQSAPSDGKRSRVVPPSNRSLQKLCNEQLGRYSFGAQRFDVLQWIQKKLERDQGSANVSSLSGIVRKSLTKKDKRPYLSNERKASLRRSRSSAEGTQRRGSSGLNFFSLSNFCFAAVTHSMNDFTDALMIALRSGQEDPTASQLGQRMKTLVAQIANPAVAKTQRARLTRELARVREAYRSNLLTR